MRTMMMLAVLGLAGLGLSGCNTVNGVGEDISGGAKTVQGWFR